MFRSPRTAILHLAAILGSLVALSSGASIPRNANPECIYHTGKFAIGSSRYLGLNTALRIFVPATVDDATTFQLRYCGNGTGPDNRFEIAVTDGNGATLGLLGSLGQVKVRNSPWLTSDLMLAIVDHSVVPHTGTYNNSAAPTLDGLYTASQIWMFDPTRSASNLSTRVEMTEPGSNGSVAVHAVAYVFGILNSYWLESGNSGPIHPLFISETTGATNAAYYNLMWLQDPAPPPQTVPGYVGPTQCDAGWACVGQSSGHSQCLPFDAHSCPPSATNGAQSMYYPCGIANNASCEPDAVCISHGGTWSQCQPLDANSTVPCP